MNSKIFLSNRKILRNNKLSIGVGQNMFEEIFEEYERSVTPGVGQSAEEQFYLESVQIDPDNLSMEFVTLSGRFAYFAEIFNNKVQKAQQAKMTLENVRSCKLLSYRERFKAISYKATVDEVNSQVQLDCDVLNAEKAMLDADIERLKYKHILDAILMKRDMLQSLGAKIRAEMAMDTIIREPTARGGR